LPRLVAIILFVLAGMARAADTLEYRMAYSTSVPTSITVSLKLPQPHWGPLVLVMPRNYPGGYAQLPYDAFLAQVTARDASGGAIRVSKDPDAPRWAVGSVSDRVSRIEYQVDVARMEEGIHDAVATSKIRSGYAGLLGYSVFAYLEGFEQLGAHLHVEAPPQWPVLSTLDPRVPPSLGSIDADAKDYYELADSQVLMGPRLRVAQLSGSIPMVMALYAEGPVDDALEARLAREALDAVQQYFGDTPLRHYTVQLELLQARAGHSYGFSQEHVESGTFSLSLESSLTADSPDSLRDRVRFNYAHHMAHSWIPKRAYGVGYRPFTWEMTPVMDTIWFNEGFGRYAAIEAIAASLPVAQGKTFRDGQLSNLRAVLDAAPAFIRRMPLEVLSREASFLYSEDFRTGRNVFARGALMAAEMDDRIRSKSQGEKSLRDALRGLLRWSDENQRPFQTRDLAGYFKNATGVEVADILERWQQPQEKSQEKP
jgi:predicted metalloprotease with PDZ domain